MCFDDGLVAVEAESRVIGCDGVAGGDVDGVRVEGTPKYLSTISKKVSGKSPLEWISEYVMGT